MQSYIKVVRSVNYQVQCLQCLTSLYSEITACFYNKNKNAIVPIEFRHSVAHRVGGYKPLFQLCHYHGLVSD